MATRFSSEWSAPRPAFRTGVSLHSHTLHSKESLDFIYKLAGQCAPIKMLLTRGERKFQRHHGVPLDLCKGWWTPPLGPAEAHRLEAAQIEGYDAHPIVSLTDHDDLYKQLFLRGL